MPVVLSYPLLGVLIASTGGLLLAPILLLGIVFWIWMLTDCARYEKEGSTKIAWMLIILFVNPIGAPVYYFLRRAPRVRQSGYQAPPQIYQPWRQR